MTTNSMPTTPVKGGQPLSDVLTDNTSLSGAYNGAVVRLGTISAAKTILLPPVTSKGSQYDFLVTAASTAAWTIRTFSDSQLMYGSLQGNQGTGAANGSIVRLAAGNTGLNLSVYAGIGTRFRLHSDGSKWYVQSLAVANCDNTGAYSAFT